MEYKAKYEQWLNNPNLEAGLKAELLKMNEKEIEDAFYTNVEFGTAGMRGILGPGTNRLNIYTIRKANVGFANYLLGLENAKEKGVAIGYDNRHMSKEFAYESARVLATYGIKSYVFESLRPTPELSYAVRHLGCVGGIVITASHNPKEYNGYKIYDDTGCQLVPRFADKVVEYVNQIEDELAIDVLSQQEAKSFITVIGKEIDEPYYQEVINIQLNKDLSKDNFSIVFSPQHGTANIPVKEVLSRLGYTFYAVESQCDPDPNFSHTKTPNPEEKAAYEEAIKLAKEKEADIVIITDPDADRVGIAVRHDGDYVLMSGNQSAAVLLDYILMMHRQQGTLPSNAVMFNTIVTSDIGELVTKSYGVDVEKTLTGFKFIGEKIRIYEKSKEKQFIFGYEESYGCVIKEFVRDKDAIQAVLMYAEAANYYKKQGKDFYQALLDLYAIHGTFKESQQALSLKGVEGAKRIQEILSNLRSNPPKKIGGYKVKSIEDFEASKRLEIEENQIYHIDLPGSNVLKYYLEDGSWIAVRPSGTEPKCKFYYCVKGNDANDAENKTKVFQEAVMKEIGEA